MRDHDTVSTLPLISPLSASWANHFTSLSLSFLICKMRSMILGYRAVVRVSKAVQEKIALLTVKCFLLLENT